ncbi:MAG: ATP-binding protein [Phormidesmis sp.]
MTTHEVPQLNLAPKRRKPLSLWNPLDYLQLLYWVFFFPQALKWYVKTFGEEQELSGCRTWSERRQWWKDSPRQRKFLLQGLLTIALVCLSIGLALNYLNISKNVVGILMSVLSSIAIGIVLASIGGVAQGVGSGIAICAGINIAGLAFLFTDGVAFKLSIDYSAASVESGGVWGIGIGLAFGLAMNFFEDSFSRTGYRLIRLSLWFAFAMSILYGVFTFVILIPDISTSIYTASDNLISNIRIIIGTVIGMVVGISFTSVVGGLRPEIWLTSSTMRFFSRQHSKNAFAHVSTIPLFRLSQQISCWLRYDWKATVSNINELLAYTQQFTVISKTVRRELAALPDDVLLLRVSQLAENPFDWNFVRYLSASLPNSFESQITDVKSLLSYFLKRRFQVQSDTGMRLDTSTRAAAAGFWYLYRSQPNKAAEAFSRLRHLPHGKEMEQLAACLDLALIAENPSDSALVSGLSLPTSPLLRADTWPAVSRLRSVVDDAQIINQSYSRPARSLALNRALGKLTEIQHKSHLIPQAERNLIVTITESWQAKLLAIATDVGEIPHTQPVHNPYVAGDPVEGDLFVGRAEIIKQLEELWLMSNQLQSVVLYGHRRMGKTSILKNLSHYLGNNIKVVYVNLQNLGEVSEGTGEVLIALSDAIGQKLSISPPDDETLLRLPEITFRRFVQTINQKLKDNQGIIIALDEFEKIEELILAKKLSPDFLGYLRGLLQQHPKIAFAFAGLHTLEEMTEDFFNPFFASILPIRIGFFSIGETRQLLANPAEDFTLDYTPKTLNEIYRLTAGQPYLIQLVGFQLVRHYNHQVFDQGQDRKPIFTPDDLTAVIHQSDFFAKGRYYFTGVWNQAAQDATGQQAILKILAKKDEGQSPSDIRRKSNLSSREIEQALKTLRRHDVVKKDDDKWTIIVPLFRQWVLKL